MEHAALIVAKLDEIMDERGIGPAEMARMISGDRKRLWSVFQGERKMRIEELVRICILLDVNPSALVTKEMANELKANRDKIIEKHGAGTINYQAIPYLLT